MINYEGARIDLTPFEGAFQNCLDFMRGLEAGEPVNISENRQVGHYWLRAPHLAPSETITQQINHEISKIRSYFVDNPFETLLYVGIGGSGLGPNLIYNAFKHKSSKKVIVFDNVDAEGIAINLKDVNPLKSCVAIVSKSGTTTETNVVKDFLKYLFTKQGIPFESHAFCVTMDGTPLWEQAAEWSERFRIWDWVGGRTSICSAVGLTVLEFLGLDSQQFLNGAAYMDELTRETKIDENPAAIVAFSILNGWEQNRRNLVILPYSDRLEIFSKYLQQLFMESLGKKRLDGERFGVTVYGNKGTTDQHSFVQQLRDGLDDFVVVFIRRLCQDVYVDDSQLEFPLDRYLDSFLLGTRKALTEAGRINLTITVPKIDEFWLGALIALFERVVGYCGVYFKVNAYDQPGVEAGKRSASEFLRSELDLKTVY